MINDSYDYFSSANKTFYFFESEGIRKIEKAIIFTYAGKNLWNLAFGDLRNGRIDDSVISNNHDIVKLISTIAKVTYEFSAKYPSRAILIRPVDEKRKKLYNHVFRRNFEYINLTFHITGVSNGLDEDYSPKKFYDNFKLKRKFVQ